jgi:hypothetical protein
MNYGATAELQIEARHLLKKCESLVEQKLIAAFATVPLLAELNVAIIYAPIIMPDDALLRYPSRTRTIKSRKTLEIAPHLSYQVFTHGTVEECVKEYVSGIKNATHLLLDLGLNKEQLDAVDALLKDVLCEVVSTRH